MDDATDKTVREVIVMTAAQLTKTTIIENILAYFIYADPSPILMVQPTVEMAQAWSKERFVPTVRDTPELRARISEAVSRESSNTIQLKTFPGGSLAIVGSNAPSGLAMRSRRVVLLDEVDRYPASAGTEGDPVSLAIKRTEGFQDAVIYLTSTPTIKGASRIESAFEQTDKRKWFIPCGTCGFMQTLAWSQVRWPEGKPELAWYQCEQCEARWTDEQRVIAIRKGEWRPTAPFKGKRGYFLNGIYSPFKAHRGFDNRLHEMAAKFLEAKRGGIEELKFWTNTFLAETWDEQGSEGIEPKTLNERCEGYTPEALPKSAVLIIGSGDVQKDRIEILWQAIGNEEETWAVETVKVYGDTEKPETWRAVSKALERVFKREDGIELRPVAFAIDIHFRPRATKSWIAAHGTRLRVFPVFGLPQGAASQPTLIQLRPSGSYSIATDYAKDIIFARLRIQEHGPRFMHFPHEYGFDEDWFRQLTCERVVTKYTRGFPKRVYEKTSGVRNEAIDLEVYALGCLDILRPNIPIIAANLRPPNIETDKKPEPQRKNFSVAPMRRGGWVTGWK